MKQGAATHDIVINLVPDLPNWEMSGQPISNQTIIEPGETASLGI